MDEARGTCSRGRKVDRSHRGGWSGHGCLLSVPRFDRRCGWDFAPAPETRRWAQTVADDLGLPSNWLNDGAKGYLTVESAGPVLHRSAGIVVRTVALAHLLALKLMAWRDDVDFRDALTILQALQKEPGIDCSSPGKLLELVDPYWVPTQRMKASYALEELWELHDPPGADRGSDPGEEPA